MAARLTCSIGLRARTALAIAVVVAEQGGKLAVKHRGEHALFDPKVPDSKQPHHAALGLARDDALRIVARAEGAAARVARETLRALRAELESKGLRVRAVGVVGSEADPTRIASPHMRAHAAEGRFFRVVLEEAARELGLRCVSIGERHAYELASEAIGQPKRALDETIAALGKSVGSPWRAHEKLASLAAWWALGSRR